MKSVGVLNERILTLKCGLFRVNSIKLIIIILIIIVNIFTSAQISLIVLNSIIVRK